MSGGVAIWLLAGLLLAAFLAPPAGAWRPALLAADLATLLAVLLGTLGAWAVWRGKAWLRGGVWMLALASLVAGAMMADQEGDVIVAALLAWPFVTGFAAAALKTVGDETVAALGAAGFSPGRAALALWLPRMMPGLLAGGGMAYAALLGLRLAPDLPPLAAYLLTIAPLFAAALGLWHLAR